MLWTLPRVVELQDNTVIRTDLNYSVFPTVPTKRKKLVIAYSLRSSVLI